MYNWREHLKEFILLVVIGLVIYYAYIIFKYYWPEWKRRSTGRRPAQPEKADEEILNPFEKQEQAAQEHNDYLLTGELMERMENLLTYASDADLSHDDLTGSIRMLLGEYTEINDPRLRANVSQKIVDECQRHGTVALEVREVDELWG